MAKGLRRLLSGRVTTRTRHLPLLTEHPAAVKGVFHTCRRARAVYVIDVT